MSATLTKALCYSNPFPSRNALHSLLHSRCAQLTGLEPPDPWLCGVLLHTSQHPPEQISLSRAPSISLPQDRWESSSAAREGTSSSRRGSLASSAGQQQVIFLLKSTAQSLNTHSWAQSGWRSHLLNKKWPLLCFVTRFRADSTLKPFGVAL